MGTRTVSATEAKNRFGRVLKEVAQTDGPIYIERDGQPVAVMISVRAYEQLHLPGIKNAEQAALVAESFGMWAYRHDLDEAWLQDGRSRWHSAWTHA